MSRTREEHLAFCKSRALDILASGDLQGAVASMVSDLGKWERPLYDSLTLSTIWLVGAMFCQTPEQVKHWIEGFN